MADTSLPGLVRVDLPGVHIEYAWFPFCGVYVLNRPPAHGIRHQPKVTSTAARNFPAEQ
jgi:hypothetical protein